MITLIFAPPRTGKTALATKIACDNMRGSVARQSIKSCKRVLEPLNNNGFNLALPENIKHLLFTDYPVTADIRGLRVSHEISGYDLGLPNKQHKTAFLPPCSVIILDEAQKYFNSRDWQRFSDFVSRFYELHGHFSLDIYIVVQRVGLIDINLRELVTRVIEVKKMRHKYDYGVLVSTEWDCRVFDNSSIALKYIESGKTDKSGEKVVFKYSGNIFKHYDSQNFFPFFIKDNYERTGFDIKPSFRCGRSLKDIKLFNVLYDYNVPETFKKQIK